jgi:hypothetical protein
MEEKFQPWKVRFGRISHAASFSECELALAASTPTSWVCRDFWTVYFDFSVALL